MTRISGVGLEAGLRLTGAETSRGAHPPPQASDASGIWKAEIHLLCVDQKPLSSTWKFATEDWFSVKKQARTVCVDDILFFCSQRQQSPGDLCTVRKPRLASLGVDDVFGTTVNLAHEREGPHFFPRNEKEYTFMGSISTRKGSRFQGTGKKWLEDLAEPAG